MEVAIIIAVNMATSFLKKYVEPKFGAPGVHAVLLICSLVAAIGYYYRNFPGVEAFFTTVGGIFVIAMSFYEVVLQYFPMFKRK